MPLSPQQRSRFGRFWGQLKAVMIADNPALTAKDAEALRHSQQVAAGCPRSSREWTPRHVDLWEAHTIRCRMMAPGYAHEDRDLDRLIELEAATHPEAGRIWHIRRLLTTLGQGVPYAAACAHDPSLPQDLCQWPAGALQAALTALSRTARRAQLPGKDPF